MHTQLEILKYICRIVFVLHFLLQFSIRFTFPVLVTLPLSLMLCQDVKVNYWRNRGRIFVCENGQLNEPDSKYSMKLLERMVWKMSWMTWMRIWKTSMSLWNSNSTRLFFLQLVQLSISGLQKIENFMSNVYCGIRSFVLFL